MAERDGAIWELVADNFEKLPFGVDTDQTTEVRDSLARIAAFALRIIFEWPALLGGSMPKSQHIFVLLL